jgi:microcystin-dependent protein
MFGGNFAPAGWAFCSGQLMPISENETLFNLIGTTYGGDGQETFALPNLQSRVPIHQGPGFVIGQAAGAETVTLTTNQIPAHSHNPMAQSNPGTGSVKDPGSNVLADDVLGSTPDPLVYAYAAAGANQRTLASSAVASSGGSQPHDNMIPFLCVNFIISLFGVYPSQT